VHYDWLTAGEHTQRTVALLSQQLRRFLDDQAWLENRRIMEILHGIESHALGLRDSPPAGDFMAIDDTAVSVALPGMTALLIRAAIDYAAGQGADIVEAYPLRTEITKLLPYERYMGVQSTFEKLGFRPAAQRSDRRPILRYEVKHGHRGRGSA